MQSHQTFISFVYVILFTASQVYGNSTESGTSFSTGNGFGGIGGGDYSLQPPPGIPIKFHNPNAKERSRLVVEWGKPSMGYAARRAVLDIKDYKYLENWKDDSSLRPDRKLSLRGRLMIKSDDGKSRKPIDWIQGVRVIVSRSPEKKFDWSHRVDMDDAVWEDTIIWNKGEFFVSISPGEIRRAIGKTVRFQVALSLSKTEDHTIMFGTTELLLPQSVAMVKIPGPPAISKTMQIINGAPSCAPNEFNNEFNAAKLVRAVNHLMPMGKDEVIRELRAFLKIARDSDCRFETGRRDEDIDTSDRTCLFLIVRLLFENEKSKNPFTSQSDFPKLLLTPFPDEKDRKHWPLYPLCLQDDVPFYLPDDRGRHRAVPGEFIDWAEKYGRIRSKPLRPIDNPMIATERLIALPQTKRLYGPDFDYKDNLYEQAWNIIEEVNPGISKSNSIPPANTFGEPDWDARVKAASKLKIHWSVEKQKYIMEGAKR